MTKNHPNLRKTVSTADLYSEPSPPPVHAGLTRNLTTIHRSRPNPFIQARALQQPISSRHSIAGPFSSLLDTDVNFDSHPQLQKSPTPPPVPPKLKLAPVQNTPPRSALGAADPAKYTKPFCEYITKNPTVFHAVDAVAKQLEEHGYSKLSERDSWKLRKGGKYYVERNGSSVIAFAVGDGYEPGNGAAILAGHVDALTAKLKPIPKLHTKAGYVQLGVAPYAGALNNTWWDRDLGIGGRVLVKEGGKIVSKLVKLDWPSR